uniref:Uncharacterized protein n=1 Tax=Globodera rostochiensis TaxID=31243 RepID=A0A914HP61_GLORO
MDEFWIFILVSLFATNSLEKAESVQLEETPQKIIDEIFGEGWWDNDKDEEWNKLTLEHNFNFQIDRQNTQIGQIESNSTDQNTPLTEYDHSGQIKPNSTDQLGQIEPNSTDQRGQIEPNSTDQNPPLTESDKRISFTTIYNWKRKLGQTKPKHKYSHSEQKELMKRYYEIKDENRKINDKDIVKMLDIGIATLYNWKKQFKRQQFHQNSVEENAGSNVQEIGQSNSGSI